MATSQPFKAKKSFGQHFLVQPSAVKAIVDTALASKAEALLEIGPGPGVLTAGLLADGRPLHAVELDPVACAHLRERFAEQPHFHLIPGDAVQALLPEVASWSVAGNLPYNVSTAILGRFLLEPIPWTRLTFMFQLEVAQRVMGKPGEKNYGPISILSQLVCRTTRLLRLGPGAFSPPPKVDSAVVVFDPKPDAPDLETRRRLRKLLYRSFGQRRKTLANNWHGLFDTETTIAILAAEGLDGRIRAEAIPPALWPRLLSRVEAAAPGMLECAHDQPDPDV